MAWRSCRASASSSATAWVPGPPGSSSISSEPGLTLLKLGGSLLTDKTRPRTARPEVIRRLAGEIATARAAGAGALVLGHGSGSFGHVAAARAGLGGGPVPPEKMDGVAETQAEAEALHRLVCTALREAGVASFSLAPGSCWVGRGGRIEGSLPAALPLALRAGLLPVVYGDVVLDSQWGAAIASTEAVLSLLARALPAAGFPVRRAIWLGDTPGVLDATGLPLPEIHPRDEQAVMAAVTGPAGTDVTGGMRLRLATAAELARAGIPSLLADGTVPGLLERALRGEPVPGTVVAAG
ncbi:MAG TPA: isopentenyl phosphate kinase [Thermoanaerobaculia bacterium]|nr:isopentenyl phosphate kinase [Thermoanaerobaculia bacterium]